MQREIGNLFEYNPVFIIKEFWLHLKWHGVQNFLVTHQSLHPEMVKLTMATIPQSL